MEAQQAQQVEENRSSANDFSVSVRHVDMQKGCRAFEAFLLPRISRAFPVIPMPVYFLNLPNAPILPN